MSKILVGAVPTGDPAALLCSSSGAWRFAPRRAMKGLTRLIIVSLAALFLIGCQGVDVKVPSASPQIVIPPGVPSKQTADQVAQKMLDEIAANEAQLGRALAPARIIKIQLLRVGEVYPIKHLDGTNPGDASLGPVGGWVVEAVGTFLRFDVHTGQISSLGIHGFNEWPEDGSEVLSFNPCWVANPALATNLDGTCK
jgi:hypothetical protein